MENVDALVHELAATAQTYQPSAAVSEMLSHKILIPVVGPFAIGKTTILAKVGELNKEFGIVHNFTTRSPRPDDSPAFYTFLPHTEETLRQLIAERDAGNLVQYAVHPTTGYIYGTKAEDYPTEYNIASILSAAVDPLRRVNFKSFHPIALISMPDDWLRMYAQRSMGMEQSDLLKRIEESRQSLAWSLAQPDIKWVINHFGEVDQTAQMIIDIACNDKPGDDGQAVAKALMETIDEILSSS